ncbi:MAG TPA: response regulator [Bryobacteraceae bacterium]|nr:response regulator [Bryobacteraceae bacterium]
MSGGKRQDHNHAPEADGQARTGGATKTILIVEDVETCAAALEIAFSSAAGLKTLTAKTAEEALQLLDQDREAFSALITDFELPEMDGLELIERIRARARFSRLPIIVVTGSTDPDVAGRLRSCGADAVFAKPYSPTLVREKLEQLLDHDFRIG